MAAAGLKNLTLVMPLFGRPLHTLRWMWHHNKVGLDCPILIGDGKPYPAIRRILSDRSLFPRLNYSYIEYDDRSYRDYFQKLAHLAGQVVTPYTMLIDNDDFIGTEGLLRSIDVLKWQADFSAAGARVCAFSIEKTQPGSPYNNVTGKTYTRSLLQSSNPFSFLTAATKDRRVLDAINFDFVVHYDVFRSEVLCGILFDWVKLNVEGLLWAEFYMAYRALTEGRVYRDTASIGYFRQQGTSIGYAGLGSPAALTLTPSWSADYQAFRKAVIDLMERGGDASEALAREFDVRTAGFLQRRMRTANRTALGRRIRLAAFSSTIRVFSHVLPLRHMRVEHELRKIFGVLKASGASGESLERMRLEFGSVEETLVGPEFTKFLKANAPELLTGEEA
jgi:glycosyltransferase domain-containing protein